VLAPVAQAALNNGHTDIRERAIATVNVKTSPLLILLTLMFLLFLSGFLPLRRDWLRKDVTRGQKNFAAMKLRIELDNMNRIFQD